MHREIFSTRLTAPLALLAATLFGTAMPTAAQQFAVLHNFSTSDKGGKFPYSSLIVDADGNLYGTTVSGVGGSNFGAVFELTPHAGQGWTEKVLHLFGARNDGQQPFAGLIFDAAGNLYSTTGSGGKYGDGTVFELMPTAGGAWTEMSLHSFNGQDGYAAYVAVVRDSAGNLYGATIGGGVNGEGNVFELTPATGGGWREEILHVFSNDGNDGVLPYGGVITDSSGNLYGTATGGGAYGYGIVFELTREPSGEWAEKILHSFRQDGTDGILPNGGLTLDSAGNLYGTTTGGGAYGEFVNTGGTVFELTPTAGGRWTEKILYNFGSTTADGNQPNASLIFDDAGNLYSTTWGGGAYGYGTAFAMTRTGEHWTEKTLHSFNGSDGSNPYNSLVLDASGNLYGTTTGGGAFNGGTVFEIRP